MMPGKSQAEMTLADRFLKTAFAFQPHLATERGYPGHDHEMPSFSAESLATFRRAVKEFRRELGDDAPKDWSLASTLDAELLRGLLDTALFIFDDLRWHENNPLLYVQAALDALEGLDLRVDLGARARRQAALARLSAMPRLLAEMRSQVRAPVKPYRDAATEMLEAGLEHVRRRYGRGGRDLAEAAKQACQALERALGSLTKSSTDVRPFAAMGKERYERLLRCDHHVDGGVAPLLAMAQEALREFDESDGNEDTPPPPTSSGGPSWRDVLAYYEHEIDTVRQFAVERDLVTVPEGKVFLRETPSYLRGLIPGAAYHPPPAFLREGREQPGYFFIRPVPRRMSQGQRDFYATVIAKRTARNLVAHEVYPGHHLQFLHARKNPSAIRKYRENDLLVEGWAFYCEKLMQEEGLYDELPSSRPLAALRMRALRVIVDVGIHTGTHTLDDAADEMCRHFGEEARPWVNREVVRYSAEPTQALSYLVGRDLLLKLREAYRARPRKGGFRLRVFHDEFLSEGSVPIPLIARKLLS